MCNSTYCDTVEPNERLLHDKFAMYSSSKDGQRLNKQVLVFDPAVNATGIDSRSLQNHAARAWF